MLGVVGREDEQRENLAFAPTEASDASRTREVEPRDAPASATDAHAATLPDVVDPHGNTIASAPPPPMARETRDPLLGQRLGHFRIDAPIGHGGMGAVYRAWDESLLRAVALKVVLGASPSSRARFLREARAQAQIRHPNVVSIHYVGEAGATTFLVMDLVDGESLADRLKREGTIPEAMALDIAKAMADALEAGRGAGLVHRDVKPSNILLERGGRVLLADFGLAKAIGPGDDPRDDVDVLEPASHDPRTDTKLTRAGAVVGTPGYLAPEQARGLAVDHRADIYALGVTLYEALTGQPPFTGETPAEVLEKHVSAEAPAPRTLAPLLRASVEGLVLRMMQKRPEDRLADYPSLRGAIEAAREKRLPLAPFFPRAVALSVDFVVLAVMTGVLVVALKVSLGGALAGEVNGSSALLLVAVLGLGLLEHAWSTPGKRMMHLRVLDANDARPGRWRLVGRTFLRMSGPLLAGALDGVFAKGTLPSRVVPAAIFLVWAASMLLAVGKRRLALHDRLFGTREVYGV